MNSRSLLPDTKPHQLASLLRLLLSLLDSPECTDPTWRLSHTAGINSLFEAIKTMWNSERFKQGYAFSNSLPLNREEGSAWIEGGEAKFEVPLLVVKVLLVHLKGLLDEEGQASVDLLYDMVYVFCHNYIADFTPLRRFIDEEIVAVSVFGNWETYKPIKPFRTPLSRGAGLPSRKLSSSCTSSTTRKKRKRRRETPRRT
jgi:hypothetical protein